MQPTTLGTLILILLVVVVEARVHVRGVRSRQPRNVKQIHRKYP